MALNSFTAPPSRIVSAPVETPKGELVGHVERVITDAEGKPSALAVNSPQGTVTVAANAASYDASRNLVVADIPAQQAANRGH
jgi:hypothetical protein